MTKVANSVSDRSLGHRTAQLFADDPGQLLDRRCSRQILLSCGRKLKDGFDDKLGSVNHPRKDIQVRLCLTWQEEELADREFWRSLTPAERILATWQLSQETWKLKGVIDDESRLHRHVARVTKR